MGPRGEAVHDTTTLHEEVHERALQEARSLERKRGGDKRACGIKGGKREEIGRL